MSRWLRTRERPEPGDVRLICFPHAGGSASFFRAWEELLPPAIELHAVQYPGREQRIAEPSLTAMDELADAVAARLTPFADRPLVLFGHSLGAAVAYEVALRLERAGLVPEVLVVSGQPAPHRMRPGSVHLGTDDELLDDVERLGAAGAAVLRAEPELRDLLLPMIRADYQVVEAYRPGDGGRLRAPITAFRGADDPDVTAEEAAAWAERTLHPRGERVFAGGHFYLDERRAEVVAALAALIAQGRPVH